MTIQQSKSGKFRIKKVNQFSVTTLICVVYEISGFVELFSGKRYNQINSKNIDITAG